MLENALWGLAGAFIYAGARLIAQLLGAEAPDRRRLIRASAQFGLALFAGGAGAAALASSVAKLFGGKATIEAVAMLLGLTANTIWPILVDGVGRRARIWSGDADP